MKKLMVGFSLFLLGSPAFSQLPPGQACRDWAKYVIDDGTRDGNFKTDQLVVMDASGKVLFLYADGAFKLKTPHEMWSVSKTVSATLLGTAIQQGKIKLSDRVTQYLPSQRKDKDRAKLEMMTMGDLIAMTSGIKWSEHNDDRAEQADDLPFMYSKSYHNLAAAGLNLPFSSTPGTEFNYSSVNGDILMAVLKKVYGSAYDQMPWTNLFKPLGMTSAHFEQDASNTFVGSAYVFLSAEDLAKLGVLYLNDGVYNGKRLLPVGWSKFARNLVPSSARQVRNRADFNRNAPYGRGGFWLNTSVPKIGKPFVSLPDDVYYASGLFGQVLSIVPSKGLVISRTAHDETGGTEITEKMTSGAIACFGRNR